MKRAVTALLALLLCMPALARHHGGAAFSVTPMGYYGALTVSGNKWHNGAGNQIQLAGTNNSGMEQSSVQGRQCWGGNVPNWTLLGQWYNGNTAVVPITRIPLNSGSFQNLTTYNLSGSAWGAQNNSGIGSGTADPYGTYKSCIISLIQSLRTIGSYIDLDLHWNAPQLTISSVTHYATPGVQFPFIDANSGAPFWTSSNPSTGIVAWLATNFGSAAFNTAHSFNGGAAGAYYSASYGGSSGFGDIVFELFNEPFLTSAEGLSTTADLTLINGATASNYVDNSPRNLTGIGWTATGYQAITTGIRALGATNVLIINGNSYSQNTANYTNWLPTDSATQEAIGWHPYTQLAYACSGSYQYPSAGTDSGGGTATAINNPQIALTNNVAVAITEDGSDGGWNGGTSATCGDIHLTYDWTWASAHDVPFIPWVFGDGDYYQSYSTATAQNTLLRYNPTSTALWPIQGEGQTTYQILSGTTAPSISTGSTLSGATTGVPYSSGSLTAANGAGAPWTWSLISATPNTGSWIAVNSSTGAITGTPGTAETESVVVQAQDQYGQTVQKTFSILVSAGSGLAAPTNLQEILQGQSGPGVAGWVNPGGFNTSYGTSQSTGTVWLGWQSSTGATSYNILDNGSTVATVTSSQCATNYSAYTSAFSSYDTAAGINCVYMYTGATLIINGASNSVEGTQWLGAATVTSSSTSVTGISTTSGTLTTGNGFSGPCIVPGTTITVSGSTGTLSIAATCTTTGTYGVAYFPSLEHFFTVQAVNGGGNSAQSSYALLPFVQNGKYILTSGPFNGVVTKNQSCPATDPYGYSNCVLWQPNSGSYTLINFYSGNGAASQMLGIAGYQYMEWDFYPTTSGISLTTQAERQGDLNLQPSPQSGSSFFGCTMPLTVNSWNRCYMPVSYLNGDQTGGTGSGTSGGTPGILQWNYYKTTIVSSNGSSPSIYIGYVGFSVNHP